MNKKIKFRVNGKKVEVEVPTNRLLIDYLTVRSRARPAPKRVAASACAAPVPC